MNVQKFRNFICRGDLAGISFSIIAFTVFVSLMIVFLLFFFLPFSHDMNVIFKSTL